MKALLNLIGVMALLLALAGLFLPLLPTTPFLLLASACFARGSARMQRWLTSNRLFGKQLRQFEETRAVPARAKASAIVFLWLSAAISMLALEAMPLRALLAVVVIGVTSYLLSLKTVPQAV
jgi:uncharacterized membrane protein YbaN (DUF454 family)